MVRIYIPDQTPEYAKLADTSEMSLEALLPLKKMFSNKVWYGEDVALEGGLDEGVGGGVGALHGPRGNTAHITAPDQVRNNLQQ